MRVTVALAVLAAACAEDAQTVCERTGKCVALDMPMAISGAPSFEAVPMFRAPVDDALAISSTFGPRWKTSASRDDFHRGIDYYGEVGAPLYAIGDGVVAGVYDNSPTFPDGGRVVVIEHAIPARTFHGQTVERMFAVYLHCDSIDVAMGATVTRGQRIAAMGMSGLTEFVHLHFETRVGTMCSMEYQRANPDSACATGFDPHVHPYLFVGGANTDALRVEEVAAESGFAVRYIATRGDLDLDVVETDFGTLVFNTRDGIDASTTAKLDDFDFGALRIMPAHFGTATEFLEYELRFDERPAFLELRDVYGNGLRF